VKRGRKRKTKKGMVRFYFYILFYMRAVGVHRDVENRERWRCRTKVADSK